MKNILRASCNVLRFAHSYMTTIEEQVSRMMSKASRARTQESRKMGGAKAWQTRLANLRAKLNRKAANETHPRP